MRPADMHLTPQELQSLLFRATDSTTTIADSAAAQEAQQHLSGCAVCQSLARKYTNADSLLRGLSSGNKSLRNVGDGLSDGKGTLDGPKRGTDCPAEQTWPNLAAGLIEEKQAARYVSHAAQCDWCGPLLKESMEDLAQPVTEEEEEALEKLPSASPGWQRAMAKKMAAASGNEVEKTAKSQKLDRSKDKAGFGWWPKLVWAGSGLAVVVVAVLVGIRLTREPDVNALLAQAYTEKRTIELRMSGAKYGPMRVERGNETRDLPGEFYTAQGIIKTELAHHQADPVWLHAQAKAHLLEWNYEKAIQEIDEALMATPNDSSLLLDKATALFQRAETTGPTGQIDYGEAAEDLSQVLKQTPDDPVALFNRAIIYEKLHLFDEAVSDWEHYLHVDPQGAWASEAQRELDGLRAKIKARQSALAEPLANEVAFVRQANDPPSADKLNQRIEDYQNLAIEDWLPRAFSSVSKPADRTLLLSALHTLGNLLATHHQDKWLNDLLAMSESPDFERATVFLGKALRETEAGNSKEAYASATNAVTFFEKAGSRPGTLRATGERIHALQRLRASGQCLAESDSLATGLRYDHYPWLNAQLTIDRSACSMMLGHFDTARSFVEQAIAEAHGAKFPILPLRATGIAASVEISEGNLVTAWTKDESGLEAYWQEAYAAPIRGHQFYDDLMYATEDLGQWHLATAFARESAQSIALTGDHYAEALDRQHLAGLAIHADDLSLADDQLRKASALLFALPQSEKIEAYRVFEEIDRAEMDLQRGQFQQAETRLNSIKNDLRNVSSFEIALSFFKVYGAVLAKQSRTQEAENAFQAAIAIDESNSILLADSTRRYMQAQEISPIYRALIQLKIKRGSAKEALAIWESFRALPLRVSDPIRGAATNTISPKLDVLLSTHSKETILSYAVLPEGLAIWICNERVIHFRFIQHDPGGIIRLARYFSNICADQSSDLKLVKKTGHELYGLLIAPVADLLPAEGTIVIENDDAMGNVPYSALWTDSKEYFASVYEMVLSPGLLYRTTSHPSSHIASSHHALIVGSTVVPSTMDFSIQPAPDVEKEARDVAEKFVKASLLIGPQATRNNIETLLPKAEILHYVGHAIANTKYEGLFLASTDSRRSADIWSAENLKTNLLRHCQLVVLSACSTGRGNQGRREVHGQMARAMLMAGVPHVIASSWDVDSNATTALMDAFYTALLSGKSVAEANHIAMNEILSNERTQHPYYWAAFSVFGLE